MSPLGSVTAQALALVPLVVGLTLGAVSLPRSVPPDDIPLPEMDARALTRIVADDDARAARVLSGEPLPSVVRAVGSALRAFNTAEATFANEATIGRARSDIDRAVRETTDRDFEALLDLRAVEMSRFLIEVRRFEQSGVVSDELQSLGGTFIDRLTKVGWCAEHRVAMPDLVRRAAFKLTWNRLALLDRDPRFRLALDEERALYAFYFTHPHAAEDQRALLRASIGTAPDGPACVRAQEAEERAIAAWLLTKIGELGKIDPTYPTQLARAAALFMKHDYLGSATVYEAWLDEHHGGLWTLRVQNHLQAALAAQRSL
jgi:hypothetical protein